MGFTKIFILNSFYSYMNQKKRKFKKILDDIENVKIQGARNIAKKALEAYYMFPTKKSKKKLLSLRPTEPLLKNVLKKADKLDKNKILEHFDNTQEKINKNAIKLIKKNYIVFTHCHSNTVVEALKFAHKKGKKFSVYNTETRPLYQGRKTSKELSQAGIKVTQFVDSALSVALSKEQGTKKADIVFLGADALLDKGVVNKIGSEVISRIAQKEKIPVYILSDSWKYTSEDVKMEKRDIKEVWKKIPKTKAKIKIKNPSFEFVNKKYITGIVTELGVMKYNEFLKKVK